MTLSLRGGDFKTLFPTLDQKGAEELLAAFLETQFAGAAHELGGVVGVDVVVIRLAVAGILENLRGAYSVLLHTDAVAVGAPEVHAGAAARGLAARAVAAAAIELDGALLVLGHSFAVLVRVAEVRAG